MSEAHPPEPRPGEEAERRSGRGRPQRPRRRELWETDTEPFPGALVLHDLETAAPDDAATILARFAAVRCMSATQRARSATGLERRAARAYLGALPSETAAPLRVLVGRRAVQPAALHRALLAGAQQAARRGHAGSAYTLLRWAYEVARTTGHYPAAARVAGRLARMALRDGARCSARRWAVRMRALLADGGVSPAAPARYVVPMARSEETKGGAYDAADRRAIAERIARREPLLCPQCNAPLSVTDVRPPSAVSYVRRRVWVLCAGCRRTAALDDAGRPGG